MEKITLSISKKLKQELVQIAHQKGMVLNEYLNILLINKIPWNMPRPKGSPNKITSKVRIKLQDLLDDLIDSLDLNDGQ